MSRDNIVAAEEITHAIIMEFQEEYSNITIGGGLAESLLETLEKELRPIIRRGAEKWLNGLGKE
jgi:hypothetical protein